MLQLQNISKSFSDQPVVKDVSFTVQEGEIFTLSGESGCGKSTLLRIIAGLEAADKGSLYFDGKPISKLPTEKRHFGLVFQNLSLFPHLTVEENLLFGVPKKLRKQTNIDGLLGMTGMSGMQARYPHQLSGGQQQRVAIARSLATKPKLLLLDEPFSGLDDIVKTKVRSEIFSLLKALKITTILVSHEPDDSFLIADRVAVMKDGQIKQIAAPKDIYEHPVDRYVAQYFGPTVEIPVSVSEDNFLTPFGNLSLDSNENFNQALLMIRPENIRISHEQISTLKATIKAVVHKGQHDVISLCSLDNRSIIQVETERTPYQVEEVVYFDFPPNKQHLFKP